ncbi:MAG: sugar-binding domain-containing protein, partial [Eubacteriales bacterium]
MMTKEGTNNTARQIIPLKEWRFNLGDVRDGWYRGADDSSWEAVWVPHDWSIKRGFSKENSSGTGYVTGGIGWYRCRFNLKPQLGKKVRITFEGVYNNSMVWCNSNYLGKRPYGYSTFVYDITEFLAPDGDNVISVKVPHTETADSRWYTGSGITRPVYVTVTGTPCVADFGIFVHTEHVTAESATVIVNTELEGGDALVRHTIIAPDGSTVAEMTGVSSSCKVKNPLLWGTESPNLYTLVT